MHVRILKTFWLIVHSEKKLKATLILQILVLTFTILLSIQFFGVHQYKVQQSLVPEYYHAYTYNSSSITKNEISELIKMQNLVSFTITISERMGDSEQYPVVAQYGENKFSKIYGQSISEEDIAQMNSVVIVPSEYMVIEGKSIGDSLDIGGSQFEIIGQNDGVPWNSFSIPYSLVENKHLQIESIDFYLPIDLSAETYRQCTNEISTILSINIDSEDYDAEVASVSSNYMIEAVLIYVLGAINLIFIQQHIQMIKKRFYSVMLLLGSDQKRLYRIILIESIVIFCLSFFAAIFILNCGNYIYSIIASEKYLLLFSKDYMRFFLSYLVGFCMVTLLVNKSFLLKTKIIEYKES